MKRAVELKVRNKIGKNEVGKLEPKFKSTSEVEKRLLKLESFQLSLKEATFHSELCNLNGNLPTSDFPTESFPTSSFFKLLFRTTCNPFNGFAIFGPAF